MKVQKSSHPLDSSKNVLAPTDFYSLSVTLNDNSVLRFSTLKGKKVLLVNTASNCGYTAQYEALEKLYQQYKNVLVIIAFPANDFMNQERDDDATIAQFCKKNYGITFPIAKKATVIKNANQQNVYNWLTHKDQNGWNDQEPTWNFCKYVIDEKGNLIHFFKSSVDPLGSEMIQAISHKQ